MVERNSFGDAAPMREWGVPAPGELDRVVVVSPHLDDAVLGCANFMAFEEEAFKFVAERGGF